MKKDNKNSIEENTPSGITRKDAIKKMGKYAALAGGQQCALCSPGFFSTSGQAACQECPATCALALLTSQDERTVALREQCCTL